MRSLLLSCASHSNSPRDEEIAASDEENNSRIPRIAATGGSVKKIE